MALSRSSQVLTWGCAEQGARPYSCACSCAPLRLSATPPRTYLCQRAYKLAKTPAHSRKTRAHSPGALAPAPLPFGPYFPRVCVCACVRAVCGLLFVCSCGCDANRAARADTQGGLRRQEQEGRYRVEEQPPYSQRRALVRSFLIQRAESERSFIRTLILVPLACLSTHSKCQLQRACRVLHLFTATQRRILGKTTRSVSEAPTNQSTHTHTHWLQPAVLLGQGLQGQVCKGECK